MALTPFEMLAESLVATLGEEATVQPASGAARTIEAEFSMRGVEEGDFVVQRPVLTAKSADVSDLGDGDTATVRGTIYTIRYALPDGQGITDLILQQSTP